MVCPVLIQLPLLRFTCMIWSREQLKISRILPCTKPNICSLRILGVVMRKVGYIFICFALRGSLSAQTNFNDSLAKARNKIAQKAMISLGTWALANIGSGFILAQSQTGEAKYFWSMNAYWNFINLGLATVGYLSALKASRRSFGFADNFEAQQGLEKLYIFNMGLDLTYIAGGFYLRERSATQGSAQDRDKFLGYGNSIILQGAFLLAMDIVVYCFHHANTKVMNRKLQRLELSAGPGQLSISYRF
jgi:hypothetical protein